MESLLKSATEMATFLFHCSDENCAENYSHNFITIPVDLPEDMPLFARCRTCDSPGFHYKYMPGMKEETVKPIFQLEIVRNAMELKLRLEEEASGKTENFEHDRPMINPMIAQIFGLLGPMIKPIPDQNPKGGKEHGTGRCDEHRANEGSIDEHSGEHQGEV